VSFDVVIVHYRCHKVLVSCLSTLERQAPDLGKIFVVDNSEDPLPSDLMEEFPEVNWLLNKKNVGFARAVNQGIAQTHAPYICLLNPDTEISGPLFGPMERWLEDHPHVGVLGPKIQDTDGTVQGSARGFPSLATAFFGRTSTISRLWPGNPITRQNILTGLSLSRPIDVDWVSGACMVIRRSAMKDVGPMDQRFFLYWEDCDWCTRCRSAGWRVVYHPGLGPVIHYGAQSSKDNKWMALYHFHRSAVLLYWKYDRTPARIGSLLATLGAILRCGVLGLRLALK
jgi:GT2 family glycosyltransferase